MTVMMMMTDSGGGQGQSPLVFAVLVTISGLCLSPALGAILNAGQVRSLVMGVTPEVICMNIIMTYINKTKYFRLLLSDQIYGKYALKIRQSLKE